MDFTSLLIFIVLIVVAYFVAKVLIEYVPRKVHWIISLLLLAGSIYLGYLIYKGIDDNIKFDKEKKVRYAKVINHLKIIRDAEKDYLYAKGDYTNDFNKLIQFIENDSIPITQTREVAYQVKERGIMVTKEKKVIDTIGFKKVIESYKNKDYKNMMKVPGTDTVFELRTGYVEKGVTKRKTPVFEARVAKEIVLKGLPKKLIEQEVAAESIDEVRGAYISVGTLDDVKDSGNWPPDYDVEN